MRDATQTLALIVLSARLHKYLGAAWSSNCGARSRPRLAATR
jgi:hypothetical protein